MLNKLDKKIKILLLTAIALIIVIGAAFLIVIVSFEKTNAWKEDLDPEIIRAVSSIPEIVPTEDAANNRESLQGNLLLTLTPKKETESFIATMDILSGEIEKIPLNNLLLNQTQILYSGNVSPDNTQIAFAVTDFREQQSDVFTVPLAGGAVTKWNRTPIDSYAALSPPQWHINGSLVFSHKKSAPIFESPATKGPSREFKKYQKTANPFKVDSESTIIQLLRNGETISITNGFFPNIYGKTDTILYSLDNALYFHSMDKKSTRGITALAEENGTPVYAARNKKLSLSENGQFLAWSNIQRNELYIFKTHNSGVSYEPYARYPTAGFWSSFSPDEKYIAFQAVRENGDAYIVIYNLENHTIVTTHDLSEYRQSAMWLTDWIHKE